jgi:hypothetical protein
MNVPPEILPGEVACSIMIDSYSLRNPEEPDLPRNDKQRSFCPDSTHRNVGVGI